MSIQNVINKAETIFITPTKTSGTTISRSGRIKSAQVMTAQPFRITVNFMARGTYADYRATMTELDRLDVINSEGIDIGSTNSGLSWITEYQGDMTANNISNLSITSYSGGSILVNTSNVTNTNPTDILFKAGDYITFNAGYRYPFVVTQDVQIGAVVTPGLGGSNVTVTLHRPVIFQTGYTVAGKGILVGNNVTWNVQMLSKPQYEIIPGRWIEFSGPLELMEVIDV